MAQIAGVDPMQPQFGEAVIDQPPRRFAGVALIPVRHADPVADLGTAEALIWSQADHAHQLLIGFAYQRQCTVSADVFDERLNERLGSAVRVRMRHGQRRRGDVGMSGKRLNCRCFAHLG